VKQRHYPASLPDLRARLHPLLSLSKKGEWRHPFDSCRMGFQCSHDRLVPTPPTTTGYRVQHETTTDGISQQAVLFNLEVTSVNSRQSQFDPRRCVEKQVSGIEDIVQNILIGTIS
jgi:hypothetical protein